MNVINAAKIIMV